MTLHLLAPLGGFLAGLLSICSVAAHRQQAYIKGEVLTYLAAIGWLCLLIAVKQPLGLVLWLAGLILGIAWAIWWYRVGVQKHENLLSRLTRRSGLVREGRSDVRHVQEFLPRPRQEYDPRTYYQAGSFFMGLNENGKPLMWAGSLPHVAIAGTTGSGKGRKLQDIAAQSVANGEALIYLDPKNDEWGPHALHAACSEVGANFRFLSFAPDAAPQVNLLESATAWEIEELFTATLDLADTGTASDFYRAKDRAAARAAATLIATGNLTLAETYDIMAQADDWMEDSPGFLGKLEELARLSAINARQGGYDLAALIEHGGGLYVVGSMTLQPVRRAQQMLFVRIQQLASRRDRLVGPLRTVCVIADEAKYHISRPILQGLGASRDKGMRVVLAFQSFTDLKDCPADMTPDMVIGAVVENTPCKLIYRLEDPDTALWLARKSGTILVDDETRNFDRNLALAETSLADRSVRQAEHFLIDTNKLMNLPAGWGVLFGQGIATVCYVSPFRVSKAMEAITPITAEPLLRVEPSANAPAIAVLADAPAYSSTQTKKAKHADQHDNQFFNMGDKP